MKKLLSLTLGILTAIGGFLDIGELVMVPLIGARFGMTLMWVIVVGVIGICLFAQMSGRVTAVSGRAIFEIIRERLGPRATLANLGASFLINLLTMTAEIGGVALALRLVTGIEPLLWVPLVAFGVWIVVWRVKFSIMQNVTGLAGLGLIVFVAAVFMLQPNWSNLADMAFLPRVPATESPATYWYYAIALFGATVTPYEVFFYSSGAVEDKWTAKDISKSRTNVLIGFSLGGILSIAIMICASVVLLPHLIGVTSLTQTVLPVISAGGMVAFAFAVVGIVGATFGATLETTLSTGYTIAQFFGWSWGKFRKPARAARFHLLIIIVLLISIAILVTGVDPVQLTEFFVVFAAIALPLTYLPVLIVANDKEYMGEHTNGTVTNAVAVVYLGLIVVASVAAIPLMIVTGVGQ